MDKLTKTEQVRQRMTLWLELDKAARDVGALRSRAVAPVEPIPLGPQADRASWLPTEQSVLTPAVTLLIKARDQVYKDLIGNADAEDCQ